MILKPFVCFKGTRAIACGIERESKPHVHIGLKTVFLEALSLKQCWLISAPAMAM
jgi:hypothetical protein